MNNNDLENRLRRLEEAFEAFSKDLHLAFQYMQPDAASSLTKSRVVLEKLIKQIYIAEMGRGPKKPLLGDMLADNQFTRKIDRRILSRMNAIRDLANLGAHGEHVVANDATRALDDLAEVLDWYLQRSEKTELNKDESPKKSDDSEPIPSPPVEPKPPPEQAPPPHLIDRIERLSKQRTSDNQLRAFAKIPADKIDSSSQICGCTAFTYYVGIEGAMPMQPGMEPPLNALCIAPFGMEEGTEVEVPCGEVGLVVGEPVQFHIFRSSVRREDLPGTTLESWLPSELEELEAIEVTLSAEGRILGEVVPVRLKAVVTPKGTLKLEAVPRTGSANWYIEIR